MGELIRVSVSCKVQLEKTMRNLKLLTLANKRLPVRLFLVLNNNNLVEILTKFLTILQIWVMD